MVLSVGRSILIIAVCMACTVFTRALPFLVFAGRPVPHVIRYLGHILPMAVMATLVVYCLRGVSFSTLGGFVPELCAAAVTVGLHLWRRNTLISILGSTVCYMLLVQLVF